MDPKTGAPDDYAELYDKYYGFAVSVALSAGVKSGDVDDVCHDIFMRYMERGDLEKYRYYNVDHPELTYSQEWRVGNFKTYFGRFVYLCSMSGRDKLLRRRKREALIVDAPGEDGTSTFGDSEVCSVPSHEEFLVRAAAAADVLAAAGVLVSAQRKRSRTWTLAEGLAACAESVEMFGKIDRGWVAERLGVGRSTVGVLIGELRCVLEDCGAEEILKASA